MTSAHFLTQENLNTCALFVHLHLGVRWGARRVPNLSKTDKKDHAPTCDNITWCNTRHSQRAISNVQDSILHILIQCGIRVWNHYCKIEKLNCVSCGWCLKGTVWFSILQFAILKIDMAVMDCNFLSFYSQLKAIEFLHYWQFACLWVIYGQT